MQLLMHLEQCLELAGKSRQLVDQYAVGTTRVLVLLHHDLHHQVQVALCLLYVTGDAAHVSLSDEALSLSLSLSLSLKHYTYVRSC